MANITLFYEVQSCQKCLYSWEGYAHGFSRGHSILEKNNTIAFAPDDLGYLVPRGEHIEIEEQLKSLGWHQLETCPRCGSRSLFPLTYSQESCKVVECIEVKREDLEGQSGIWRLSQSGIKKFA